MNKDISKIWLGLLAILMLVACMLSFNALHFYLTNPENISRNEALIGIAYMGVLSLLIAIPYFVTLIVLRKNLNKKFTLISAIPFIIMSVILIYGTYLGIPW